VNKFELIQLAWRLKPKNYYIFYDFIKNNHPKYIEYGTRDDIDAIYFSFMCYKREFRVYLYLKARGWEDINKANFYVDNFFKIDLVGSKNRNTYYFQIKNPNDSIDLAERSRMLDFSQKHNAKLFVVRVYTDRIVMKDINHITTHNGS
jgi:hypothetical protein